LVLFRIGADLNIDLFLWPMLIPMIIPLVYSLTYKKESFKEIAVFTLSMIVIVIAYWPLTTSIITPANIAVKFFLFVVLPLVLLVILQRDKKPLSFNLYGIQKRGTGKSVTLGLMFLPIMLLTTFVVKYYSGDVSHADLFLGSVSFIESFTEEFFFRGILFLFLFHKTNLKLAYTVSLASFVLMHPQNFMNLFLLSTVVQGILTIEICRRSENLTGAWIVHGANRFFTLAVIPFIIFST
jgi:membrane protease YdiL (CAAX protease family)